MPIRPDTKCFLFSWVPAWGAGIFLASGLIAGLELASAVADCGLACTITVADAIPPQAKLAFGALLGALMWLARRKRPQTLAPLMLCDAMAGAAAAAVVLVILPGGFGIPFLDAADLPPPDVLYPIGAAVGGPLGTLFERSCRRKLVDK